MFVAAEAAINAAIDALSLSSPVVADALRIVLVNTVLAYTACLYSHPHSHGSSQAIASIASANPSHLLDAATQSATRALATLMTVRPSREGEYLPLWHYSYCSAVATLAKLEYYRGQPDAALQRLHEW